MIIATAGLRGSASTWTFNVVRELAIAAHGADRVVSGFANTFGQLPADYDAPGRVTVLKSHVGSPRLDAWLLSCDDTRIVINLRDPRDAVVSATTRFGFPLDRAIRDAAADCGRLLRLLDRPHVLLRYETRFFERDGAVDTLAASLDLVSDPGTHAAIAARFRPDAVRRFAAGIEGLPPERIMRNADTVYDHETQYHATHIGDGRSGKWRELDSQSRQAIEARLAPFLQALGYAP